MQSVCLQWCVIIITNEISSLLNHRNNNPMQLNPSFSILRISSAEYIEITSWLVSAYDFYDGTFQRNLGLRLGS